MATQCMLGTVPAGIRFYYPFEELRDGGARDPGGCGPPSDINSGGTKEGEIGLITGILSGADAVCVSVTVFFWCRWRLGVEWLV